MDNKNLKRIADALEEILRLVKKDLDAAEAYRKKQNDQKNFQPSDLYKSLALARGQWLQEGSVKLQAPSRKLDKKALQDYKGV